MIYDRNIFVSNNKKMTPLEILEERKNQVKGKLFSIVIPNRQETSICWAIGKSLGVTGTTVQNYLRGKVKDGYLAEAIYEEFLKIKMVD
jgi:hypothetical protein